MKNINKILVLGALVGCTAVGGIGIKTYMDNNTTNAIKETENIKIKTMEEQLKNIPSDKLYQIKSEYSFAFEPTPEKLYEEADIVIVGSFNSNIKTYAINGKINTTTMFNTSKILKNVTNDKIDQNITFERSGGLMSLNDYINASQDYLRPDEFINVTEKTKKSSYITEEYSPNNILDFNNTKDEYVIFLKYVNGRLLPICDYHGIRKIDNNKLYNYDSKTFEQNSVLSK